MISGRAVMGQEKEQRYVGLLSAASELYETDLDQAAALLDQALEQRWKDCVIVAHGGTQMAVLERFAVEKKDYYSWQLPCGHGYRLDAARWQTERKLEVLGQTDYTEGTT